MNTRYQISESDRTFSRSFMALRFPLEDFDHRAHIRLAYILLRAVPLELARDQLRTALIEALRHRGMAGNKYHETLTCAWLRAVRHFMHRTEYARDAADFIDQNPALLDTRIMLTHYSEKHLFCDAARSNWLAPDLQEIPEYPDVAA